VHSSAQNFFRKRVNPTDRGRVYSTSEALGRIRRHFPTSLAPLCGLARANTPTGETSMILLYTLVLLLLGAAKLLLGWRAAAVARKCARTAVGVDRLTRDCTFRDGNGNRVDVCRTAKRYYELGRQVQNKERLEAKQARWQSWAD